MPPPRLVRPLRPWHPPRTSAHTRWTSSGPRDKKTEQHDDHAPGRARPALPATQVNADANQKSQDAPAAGWLGRLTGRISSLLSTSPVAPQPSNQPPSKIDMAAESRANTTTFSGDHPPASTSSSSEPPSGEIRLVGNETPSSTPALHSHTIRQEPGGSRTGVFRNRDEANRDEANRDEAVQMKEVGADGYDDQGSKGLFITYKSRKTGRRFCRTCNTPLNTTESRIGHILSEEACRRGRIGKSATFTCCECRQSFTSLDQAREHVLSSPQCMRHMRIHNAQPQPHEIPAHLLPAFAESEYASHIRLLLTIATEVKILQFSNGATITRTILDHLRSTYQEAKLQRDLPALALFGQYAVVFEELDELEARRHASSIKTSTQALVRAEKRFRALTDALHNNVLDLKGLPASLIAPIAESMHSYLKPTWDEATLANDRDQLSKLTKPIRILKAIRKAAKPKDSSTTHATVLGSGPAKTAHIQHRSNEESLANLPNSSVLCEVESTSTNVRPSVVRKVRVKENPLFSKENPNSSITNTDANDADLRLQVQQLMDQVKLLQEKIAAANTDVKVGTDLNKTQSTGSQVLDNAKVSLASDKDLKPETEKSPMQVTANVVTNTAKTSSPSTTVAEPTDDTRSLISASRRRYEPKLQAQLQKEQLKTSRADELIGKEATTTPLPSDETTSFGKVAESDMDGQRRVLQDQRQARLMKPSENSSKTEISSSPHVKVPRDDQLALKSRSLPAAPAKSETNTPSLLDELFPEANTYTQPHYTERNSYPKLNPPNSTPLIRPYAPKEKLSKREKYMEAFQKSLEKVTALQLLHCSTELTEADFRRLVPRGQHIEGWARDGDIHKIIPGRDPLSLERLPFYYLLFANPEAALRYQRNAYRLHQLNKLHGPTSHMSAIPPPRGLLENGEDANTALSSYLLTPTNQHLQLNMVVQPYNRSLARLIEQGGYAPIVPNTTTNGKRIHKVLFYIEGYEPSPYDIFQILKQDALKLGLSWPFLHEHQSIHRLRDIVDLKAKLQPVSSANPRAASRKDMHAQSHDPYASFSQEGADETPDSNAQDAKSINQIIMNRVYNRWIIEFSEEEGAKRFARVWHRKVLPMQSSWRHRTWRDLEEVRMCNAEYLW